MILAYTATGILVTMLVWVAIEFIMYLYKNSTNPDTATEGQVACFLIASILTGVYIYQAYRIGHFLLAPYIK
jgi:hypothetical protein